MVCFHLLHLPDKNIINKRYQIFITYLSILYPWETFLLYLEWPWLEKLTETASWQFFFEQGGQLLQSEYYFIWTE